MAASSVTEVQYGVRYQNGTEDWDTQRWYGTIDIPESRETFREQYDLRMASFGMPKMSLEFLTRTVTVTYSEEQIIDDTVAPAPEPAPETETEAPVPDTDAPVSDVEVPAAPEEGVEPPTPEAPVEEELPEDADGPVITDPTPPATDDEGATTDGKQQ